VASGEGLDVGEIDASVSAAPAGPRPIEELRTAGIAEMTAEELAILLKDLGDPTAESSALHERVARTQDALAETIRETNREIGRLRDEINDGFPKWQARLEKIRRCRAEIERRGSAQSPGGEPLSPEQAKMRLKAVESGSIAG
jgi:hypothetical protein